MEKSVYSVIPSATFLCSLHECFQSKKSVFFVIEFCSFGNLRLQMKNRLFPEYQARFIICQILLGLNEIHQQGFVLKDLKPENVLLGEDGYIRLADFGLA